MTRARAARPDPGHEAPRLPHRALAPLRRALLGWLVLGGLTSAQAAERLLDQLSADGGSVVVQFNCAMTYVSNYPQRMGDELRIELQPLPGCPPGLNLGETLPVQQGNRAGLLEVRLEPSLGGRRALTLRFARIVDFTIHLRPGLTGLEIVIGRRGGRSVAEPAEAPTAPSRAPQRTLPPTAELEQLAAHARTAMQDRDYDAAIRLYTKLLEYPEHAGRPQAQEYLGLARERKGQLAQAKLEYLEYLRRYPDGTDAELVKQRLAAIVTLDGASVPGGDAPDGSRWQLSGALAQEYRNDRNTLTSGGVSASGVGQAALDSNADLQLRRRGDVFDFKARVYAGYLADMHSLQGVAGSEVVLPQAFIEVDDSASHWVGRLGRQSQSTGGVYGTFDGVYFGWLVRPGLRLGVAAGSPLQTYAATFSHEREFGNLSAEFLGVVPGLDLSAFAYQSNASGVLDARQVGVESRYYRNGHSIVGQLDYDLSYHVLNSATVLASWALPGRWTFTGIGDHRKTPFAGTFNALIGQPTSSLGDLVSSLGIDAVRALALDRSAASDTVTLGVQRPVGERMQWGVDAAFSRIGGAPASGGVAAVPSSGTAISLSTQLLGGGWLVDSDIDTVGLSYTSRAGTKVESVYGTARYSLASSVRIGPRLQLSYTTGNDPNTGTSAGWSASPALLADWRFRRGSVQFEAGYERAAYNSSLGPGVPIDPNNPSPTLVDQSTKRVWFSLGYTVSF